MTARRLRRAALKTALRTGLAAAVSASVVLGVAGCGVEAPDLDRAADEQTTGPSAPGETDDPHQEGGEHLHEEETAPPQAQDAVTVAGQWLELWARPQVGYAQWWADLEPLMTPAGQQAYVATDPTLVPALEILDAGTLDPQTVDTSAVVRFTTGQGVFKVRLSRTGSQAGWKVGRVYFPDQEPDLPAPSQLPGQTG
ncbi:hypothetical protein [Nocardioides alkalitolerans]|uniref:hypothetical protein n=1 Tax=Nocardioides alkalitolerans TaxID=281714 RepID=UPI00048EAE89|nr:hypothetical protein [Nocardioides alkalitolerans]